MCATFVCPSPIAVNEITFCSYRSAMVETRYLIGQQPKGKSGNSLALAAIVRGESETCSKLLHPVCLLTKFRNFPQFSMFWKNNIYSEYFILVSGGLKN
jgi:hypothetical protein